MKKSTHTILAVVIFHIAFSVVLAPCIAVYKSETFAPQHIGQAAMLILAACFMTYALYRFIIVMDRVINGQD